MTIKFNKHNVRNTTTGAKARVHYALDNHISNRPCVALYGKTCLENLTRVFGDTVINNSDYQTDYVESDRIRFFEGDALYVSARTVAIAKAEGKP